MKDSEPAKMTITITGTVANKMSKEDSGAALIADLDDT